MRGLTHAEIAQAVGVSRRQWVRYEQGSKMLRKWMPAVARTLNVPLETMLERAGYRTSPRRNDVKGRLARMAEILFVDRLDFAVLELLRLNERISGNRGGVAPRAGGLSATDFANAVMLLDRLPTNLFGIILHAMQERARDKPSEPKTLTSHNNLIRKKCIEALGSEAQRILVSFRGTPYCNCVE
jgi:transcriptional regulator with XRE-family HTH domain